MKKIFNLKTVGLVAMILAICLNYVHAVNDYGVLENNLYWKVLGQTSSSGDGSGGSSGGNTPQKNCPGGCRAGGCGSSSCELEISDFTGTQKVKVDASAGYFACCYISWTICYAKTYSQKDCCSQ